MTQSDSFPSSSIPLVYHSLRRVTSPEDESQGRRRFCGVAPANSIFPIVTSENVREFLDRDDPDGSGSKSTAVHLAIRRTLENHRANFSLLNSGVVIVAEGAEVDHSKRTVTLQNPSIINGARTKDVLEEFFVDDSDVEVPSISFELIVTSDPDLATEIAIARNFQGQVDDISIYSKRGRFEDLERVMRKEYPKVALKDGDADYGDVLDTEKLIQVITALAPRNVEFPSVVRRQARGEAEYRAYAYCHRSRCLKDFAEVMSEPLSWKSAYNYCLTIAPEAWRLYSELKGEQHFSSLPKVKGEIVNGQRKVVPDGVPDGIVFPILSALSRFVENRPGKSTLRVPERFPWHALYTQAEVLFKTTAGQSPQAMGKDPDCYVALHGVIDMYLAATQSFNPARAS